MFTRLGLALLLAFSFARAISAQPAGFTALFNGRDLTGAEAII